GSGVGLSTDGDAVNIFDPQGDRLTGVSFGFFTTGISFDNAALLNGAISALSVAGRNGAFVAVDGIETGSPGTVHPAGAGRVGGRVRVPLALTLGAPASFGPFPPGPAHDYTASTTATVTSTAGTAALSVTGANLANGANTLPQPLQANADGGVFAPVS